MFIFCEYSMFLHFIFNVVIVSAAMTFARREITPQIFLGDILYVIHDDSFWFSISILLRFTEDVDIFVYD